MITILIIGFSAICFCLVGIGFSLDRIGDALENIAMSAKKDSEGHRLFPKYTEEEYYKCSKCGTDYPALPAWDIYDVKEYLKHCSNCSVKMSEEPGYDD